VPVEPDAEGEPTPTRPAEARGLAGEDAAVPQRAGLDVGDELHATGGGGSHTHGDEWFVTVVHDPAGDGEAVEAALLGRPRPGHDVPGGRARGGDRNACSHAVEPGRPAFDDPWRRVLLVV